MTFVFVFLFLVQYFVLIKIQVVTCLYLFLVIKARSIDVTKDPKRIISEEVQKLQNDFEIIQQIDLLPFDKDHAMIVAKSIN